jgi:tRNA U34 5-carboxymethylaminomethyl modifying GTPase MnmE/TrmE
VRHAYDVIVVGGGGHAAYESVLAADSFDHITGPITTDDILDRVFLQFCIGK